MTTKNRVDIQLAVPFEQKRLAKWKPPYLVQPKLDGERCRAEPLKDIAHTNLLSSTAELITSVPLIMEVFEKIHQVGLTLPELDGELYCHGWSFDEIHSVVSRKYASTLHPNHDHIKYHVFDIVTDEPQVVRVSRLNNEISRVFADCPFVEIVPCHVCYSYEEVEALGNQFMEEGYEGFIVRELNSPYKRSRSTSMMKFKPKQKDDYEIVRIYEAVSEDGEPLNMMGGCVCVKEDTEFRVGAGQLNHAKRREVWNDRDKYLGGTCHVGYQNLTKERQVPRHGLCLNIKLEKFEDES